MAARYFKDPPEEIPSKEVLTDVLLFEVVHQFKIREGSALYRLLHWLGKPPAARFADIMQRFDRMVAESSLWEAARSILPQFVSGVNLSGQANIPSEGPVLIAGNHPGGADAIAAMATVERQDVHMMVIEHSMLTAMPNFNRQLINVEEENPFRFDVMRHVIKLLEKGEAVIIFPRGNLEPDPLLYPGALESLKHWSTSLGLFLSKVPDTIFQPLLISGTVVPKAWSSLLAKSSHSPKTRHQIAMVFQTAMQRLFPNGGWKVPINLNAVPGKSARDLEPSLDANALNHAVRDYVAEQMRANFPQLS